MFDETENIRSVLAPIINADGLQDASEEAAVIRLKKEYGNNNVWLTADFRKDFVALGFMSPFVVVKCKKTGKKGSLTFQHHPRVYFDWNPSD